MIDLRIPVIETERMILRGPLETDFPAALAFCASDRSNFVGGQDDRWHSWRSFCASIGHWVLRGYGFWTADMKDGSGIAGRLGFIFHDGWDEPELGWSLFDGFEGRGLAFEGAMAVREHGARHLGLNGVVSHIDADNTRSLRLAERLGATYEGPGQILGHPTLVYRHPWLDGHS